MFKLVAEHGHSFLLINLSSELLNLVCLFHRNCESITGLSLEVDGHIMCKQPTCDKVMVGLSAQLVEWLFFRKNNMTDLSKLEKLV